MEASADATPRPPSEGRKMSQTPMEIYSTHETPDVEGAVNAVYAHARREALEEVAEWSRQVRITIRGIDGQAKRRVHRSHFNGVTEEIIDGYELNTGLWHRLLGLLSVCPISEGINASPGSGVPDDAEGRGRAPSTAGGQAVYCHACSQGGGAERSVYHLPPECGQVPSAAGDPIQRGDPVSKHFPTATTNAAPQEIGEYNDSLSEQLWTMPAAAAPSGPTEEEVVLAICLDSGGYALYENTRTLARAVLRWKEQSK